MVTLLAKPVAQSVQLEVKQRAENFQRQTQRAPKLVVVLVGEDPASVIYTRKKGETAVQLGLAHETLRLPVTSSPNEVKTALQRLNSDPSVDGILLQRPLPKNFKEEEVVYWISPEKDVDAFHPINTGRLHLGLPCLQPCTPAGVMKILNHYQISPAGKIACVIGRSSIVGKPMAALLLQADATVLHCHSRTPDLRRVTQQAEILVVAVGKMEMIDQSYIRKGAVVIDVGIHRNPQGKIVGDVKHDGLDSHVSAITPVPGGVGPMTIAMLMLNTIQAAENSNISTKI